MIVKNRDATSARIAYLETLDVCSPQMLQSIGVRQASARLKADCTTDSACQFIDDYFASSDNWLVLHDLRLQHRKHIIHVNHLLFNSAMEFYCVDTRYINFGLSIAATGVCHVRSENQHLVIASPITKMSKDVRVLSSLLKHADLLPRHFGVARPALVKGYVLTSPGARLQKPPSRVLDTSSVVSADSLFSLIWRDSDNWLNKRIKPASQQSMLHISRGLMGLHQPAIAENLMHEQSARKLCAISSEDSAHCGQCGSPVSELNRQQSFRNMDSFDGEVLCSTCQGSAWSHASAEKFW